MEILSIFKHSVVISVFVFVMMLLVDFVDTVSHRRMSELVKGGLWRQYILSSFLGSTPGCLGAFMNVSLYVRGLISFGAIIGGMIATSGDEAFVMLAQFPMAAMALFGLLFVCGVLFAPISDKIISVVGITPCKACREIDCEQCLSDTNEQEKIDDIFRPLNLINNFRILTFTRFLLLILILTFLISVLLGIIGPSSWDWKRITFIILSLCALYIASVATEHYLQFHIWEHIIKKHLLRVFLWTFGALFFVHWGLSFWHLDTIIQKHMWMVLVSGAFLGIVPESGPHLIFVMLYAQGMVPFSVLFTASFVQDGHGMLPLLSYSIKDSLLIKSFNLIFGIVTGGLLYTAGF